MNTGSTHAVLDWSYISVMMSQSVSVIAVANTIGTLSDSGKLGPFKVSRTIAALLASLVLTFYAAFKGGWSWQPGRVLEVLAYALILFSLSAGTQQSVVAVVNRMGARGAGAPGPAAAPARRGWWASWF